MMYRQGVRATPVNKMTVEGADTFWKITSYKLKNDDIIDFMFTDIF